MKKYIIKSILLLAIGATTFTSCTSDNDFDTPPFKEAYFLQTFENHAYGSGNTEVNVDLPGVINTNTTNTPLWNVKQYNSNRYMQFSSYYSTAGSNDNTWLILPAATLGANESATLSFDVAQAFPVGTFPLKVRYSSDFTGNQSDINTATWTDISYTFPSATPNYEFVKFLNIEIPNTASEAKDVYVAFYYQGAKTGGSTHTIQVDNIKLIKQ